MKWEEGKTKLKCCAVPKTPEKLPIKNILLENKTQIKTLIKCVSIFKIQNLLQSDKTSE